MLPCHLVMPARFLLCRTSLARTGRAARNMQEPADDGAFICVHLILHDCPNQPDPGKCMETSIVKACLDACDYSLVMPGTQPCRIMRRFLLCCPDWLLQHFLQPMLTIQSLSRTFPSVCGFACAAARDCVAWTPQGKRTQLLSSLSWTSQGQGTQLLSSPASRLDVMRPKLACWRPNPVKACVRRPKPVQTSRGCFSPNYRGPNPSLVHGPTQVILNSSPVKALFSPACVRRPTPIQTSRGCFSPTTAAQTHRWFTAQTAAAQTRSLFVGPNCHALSRGHRATAR